MNKRYLEIFKIKADNFITDLERAKSLYEDLSKKNNLIHSGEYGMYKERTLRELLKFIVPFKYEITDGYIINSSDESSTQCDIILFDKVNTPLIEFGNRFQFIPVESVVAIGEVKSTLTKNQLIDTALKLSKNKQICKPSSEYSKLNPNYKLELFAPFSFIICDNIIGINDNYTFKDLVKDIAKKYKEENIEVNNFFNIIICLSELKAIGYRTSCEFKNPDVAEGTKIYYPFRWGIEMNGSIVNCSDKYNLIREFASSLAQSLNQRPEYFPDPVDYLWE
jgi:hypothetical protein